MDRSRRGGMKGRKVGPNRIQEKFKTHWDVGKPRKWGKIRISPYIQLPINRTAAVIGIRLIMP